MGKGTKISWCDATWNPVSGCTPVSEGCEHCYARALIKRFAGLPGWPSSPDAVTFFPERLQQLTHWRDPQRIFVCSMSDLFHEDVTDDQIYSILDTALRGNRRHTYMILTKRPQRMKQWFADNSSRFWHYHAPDEPKRQYVVPEWPDSQLWLGVTAENQKRADERIPILLQIPAAVHFVSVEPMLGPIDLRSISDGSWYDPEGATRYNALTGSAWWGSDGSHGLSGGPKLDWVLCGGETGKGAREINGNWARDLRNQCVESGVPFHFKAWGAARPGRLLDDVEWNEFPKGERWEKRSG